MDKQEAGLQAAQLEAHARLLRELIRTEMWDCYTDYLTKMMKDRIDRMLNGTKEEFDFCKGVVMGLKDAMAVPDNVIHWAARAAATRNGGGFHA